MKVLLLIVVVIGGAVAAAYFAPQDLKVEISTTSLGRWVTETVPNFLREKLSIPENPVVKRRELLDQLTLSLLNAKHDLEKAIPAKQSLPNASVVRSSIAKVEETINATQAKIEELKSANSGESVFRKAALRVVDKIFPPATTTTAQCAATSK